MISPTVEQARERLRQMISATLAAVRCDSSAPVLIPVPEIDALIAAVRSESSDQVHRAFAAGFNAYCPEGDGEVYRFDEPFVTEGARDHQIARAKALAQYLASSPETT